MLQQQARPRPVCFETRPRNSVVVAWGRCDAGPNPRHTGRGARSCRFESAGRVGDSRATCVLRQGADTPSPLRSASLGTRVAEGELAPMVLVVLGGVMQHVLGRHEVLEIGIPADGKVHASPELLLAAPSQGVGEAEG